MRLTCRAPAKVNLYLRVVGRRADGMHLLDSLVAFCDLSDTLTIEPCDRIALTVGGPFADQTGEAEANLVLKAARVMVAETPWAQGAMLTLIKNTPVAAGLGGGSADAAATLRGLDTFWNTGCSPDRLSNRALALGADVPACLVCRPMLMGGVGEVLTPVQALPPCPLLIVHPRVPVMTADVFRALAAPETPQHSAPPPPLSKHAYASPRQLAAELAQRGNDLLPAATRIAPVITDVLAELAALPGALHATMSGSGAACFALFADTESAERGAARLAQRRPHWWQHVGRLLGHQENPITESTAALA
jgi:4-diphosphocytidyl-2-C-methyl-D-erythritol kinase